MKCKYCVYFHPEGPNDGACSQLSQSVHGDWPACSLACFTSIPALTTVDWADAATDVVHRGRGAAGPALVVRC